MVAFCDGAEAAFVTLFERHAGAIRRLAARLTGSEALALDITQATFFSVVKARGRFVRGAAFRPWLFTIAMNAIRDHKRRAHREQLSVTGDVPEQAYEPAMRDPGLERKVREALAELPENQREAVLLRHFEGFSYREIADIMDIQESAARVRAHRGFERLREMLAGTWSGHE